MEKHVPRPTKPSWNLKTDVTGFRERLVNLKSKTGWLKNFSSADKECESEDEKLPTIHNIPFNYSDSKNVCTSFYIEEFKEYFQSITFSAEDCDKIVLLTRNQSDNLLWKAARVERVNNIIFW